MNKMLARPNPIDVLALSTLCLLLLSDYAAATTVTFSYAGTDGAGATVSGTFGYDTDAPDINNNAFAGVYLTGFINGIITGGAADGFSFNLNMSGAQTDGHLRTVVSANEFFSTLWINEIAGVGEFRRLELESTSPVFDDISLPTELNVADWSRKTLDIRSLAPNIELFDFTEINKIPALASGLVSFADMNSNGSAEVAVLVEGGSTHVHIRDGMTDELLSDINFGDDPVIDIEVIPDLNGSGDPEIAVLGKRPSGQMRAFIKDSVTGAIVATPLYGSQYVGVDMTVLSDYSGNALPELAVMGQDASDRVRVQVRDPWTDVLLNNMWYGTTATAHSVITLPDVTGNAIDDLFTLGIVKSNGFPRGHVRDPSTTLYHKTIFFNSIYTPVKMIPVPDIDASGAAEVAELGQDPVTNTVLVQVRDAIVGAPPIRSMFLGSDNTAIDMVMIEDTNGNGTPDIAVLLRDPGGTGFVKIRDSLTGVNIRNIFFGAITDPVGIVALDDYSGNAAQEIAVLGQNAGIPRVQIRDSLAGMQINNVDFP